MAEPGRTSDMVSNLIEQLRNGDRSAVDRLFTLLYDELRDIAGSQRRRWGGNHTLNTTALVHEAYVKLVGQARIDVEGRAHFRALAARAMRHILCDYARDSATKKRGGHVEKLPFDELLTQAEQFEFSETQSDTLLALDTALRRLEHVDARQARVVECRFFGGLTIDETATALDISARTVKRDWAMAQAWLHRELSPHA